MKYSPDEHNGHPAAPESETPETDAFKERLWDALADSPKSRESNWEYLARSLERRLSLAQTEIKGHIKVVDELRVDLRRTKAELACAEENFHVTNQAYVKADVERTQAQSRIAELEKDAARLDSILDIWEAHRSDQDAQDPDEVDSYDRVCDLLDAALKDRA